jgi:hypothetical protein
MEQEMKKTLFTAALAACLGFCSDPSFAKGYVVNGHAALAAEEQFLIAHGFEPGAWVVDGYGIGPANTQANLQPAANIDGKKCRYVLNVKLCN